MKKNIVFVFIGFFVLCFAGLSVFFALQGISAANKEQEYFDVFRLRAEEYIKSSAEITSKYGQDISVGFDDSVTYSASGERGFFDKYMEAFFPEVPSSLEEFCDGIDMIRFNVEINGDNYEIIFEKNDQGELAVTSLEEETD